MARVISVGNKARVSNPTIERCASDSTGTTQFRFLNPCLPSYAPLRFLPAHHYVRDTMQPYLSGSLDEQIQLSQLPRPPPRTHEENVANGILSDASVLSEKNKNHPSKSNGRKGVDVFSRILPYWNRLRSLFSITFSIPDYCS